MSAPTSTTFNPAADAYTSSDRATTNFGTSTALRVDASPVSTSYLRFNVQGLSSRVTKATLRVFSNSDSSSKGVDLRSVASNTWGETTLNHNNRPPTGSTITSHVGAFTAGQWISFNATSLVTGNGLVSMALTTTSTTSRGFQSREDAAHAPQLVVETADVTPPAVTLTSPLDGSSTNDSTPTFTGAAGAAIDDSATVRVRLYSGSGVSGSPVQTLTTTRSGSSWSATGSTALSDGTYTAQADQSDAAGNSGVSVPRTFTVDTFPPAVTLTSPSSGSLTTDATPAFSGGAGAAPGDASTVAVDVFAGTSTSGSPLQTLTAARLGNAWSVEPASPLVNGTYTARARQFDAVGNAGVSSASTFIVAASPIDPPPILDITPPNVSLATPANGASTNDTIPTFSGGAGAQSGDAGTVTVTVFAGSTPTGTPVESLTATVTAASWSIDATPALGEGTYTARAEQMDEAGNRGVSSANTFEIDTTAPAVGVTEPADGSSTADRTPTFSGGAGAAAGDSSTVTVNVYSGSTPSGSPVQALTATASGNSWSVDATSTLPLGTYTVRAEQSDQAGNRGISSAITFTVRDPVLLAAGDIACDPTSPNFNGGLGTTNSCHQKATSDLLASPTGAEILALGDNQYEDGTVEAFQQAFDPSWGRFKSRIHPVAGNHEYQTAAAAGYFDYFNGAGNATGPAGERGKGYYSFDTGSWHVIALNSNCAEVGGCNAGSPQEQWLRSDLAAHPNACTLAYWHHPLFSSGLHGNTPSMAALWQVLYDARADVVLTGHDHLYERFGPQNANGVPEPARGIREFVVGTGGSSHYNLQNVQPNSAVRSSDTFGVLKLTLHDDGYDWEFVPEAGKTFADTGSARCDVANSDTAPPSAPSGPDRHAHRELCRSGLDREHGQRGGRGIQGVPERQPDREPVGPVLLGLIGCARQQLQLPRRGVRREREHVLRLQHRRREHAPVGTGPHLRAKR